MAQETRLITSYMRFFATLLITNAHIGPLYPSSLQLMSTGGALGNSLFFFCSGYALYLSNREQGFYTWITRRFTRIYPSLWIFMIICTLFKIESYHIQDIIIPTYWFLQAILVFYILLFFTLKYFNKYLWTICILLLIPFFFTYFNMKHDIWIIENISENNFLHWYFYYIIMLLGVMTAQKQRTTNVKRIYIYIMVPLILLFYYSLKIQLLHTQHPIYNLQLLLPLLLGLFAIYTFKLCETLSTLHKTNMTSFILFISKLTLDIYCPIYYHEIFCPIQISDRIHTSYYFNYYLCISIK